MYPAHYFVPQSPNFRPPQTSENQTTKQAKTKQPENQTSKTKKKTNHSSVGKKRRRGRKEEE